LTPPIPKLRFRAPDDQIENVVAWFRQRADRETTIGRKLTERLTKKRLLSRNDLEGLTERLSKYRRHRGARNASGEQTIYLIEVFNVVLSHRANGLLKQAAKVDTVRRKVYFATPAEINAGITRDGVSIAPISKFMVQG
jgi:hypothetical protein